MARPLLKDYSLESLRERFVSEGLPAYRAEQVASWLYGRGVEDVSAMTDLSHELRERLAAGWDTRALEVETVQRSVDGTVNKLQAYITGCYGSLTSFNVLFADDDDQFKGAGKSD